jgi:hypothetical protein
VEQPALPTVGLSGAVLRNVDPELIRKALTIGGEQNTFFWFMNRLQYKGSKHSDKNLPFRFLEAPLMASPPRWMDGVENRLQQLVARVKETPGSRFITPDELADLFEPQNVQPVGKGELCRIAGKLLVDWKESPPDFVDLGERGYSLANAYEAMAKSLAHYGQKQALPDRVMVSDLYGPIAERSEITYCKVGEVPLSDLCAAAAAALKDIVCSSPQRVPVKVSVGKTELNCAEFLQAMAKGYLVIAAPPPIPESKIRIAVTPSKVMPPYADLLARFFRPDDDRPLRYSQLQMWTAKPAVAKGADRRAVELVRNPQAPIRDLKPIYFTFGFHWDNPVRREREGPVRGSVAVREMTDLLERHGIRAHYGFVGAVALQLAEDFPDTVAKIRKLKLAIGYHPGAGHNPRGPHAPLPDMRGLSPDEALRVLWTFETRARYPNDDWQAGQLIPNVPGGWLALQIALGVTPLQTDAGGHGALYEAMGAGYPMSQDESSDALPLPGLHEIHIYGDAGRFVIPPTYYGKRVGELAPVTVDILEWFRILAENLPRDRAYTTRSMSHANMEASLVERLVSFMKRRGDFCITAPDPDGWQWKTENSPLAFYQKRYGVKSLAEVMSLAAPLEELRPRYQREVTDPGWWGGPTTKNQKPTRDTRPVSLSRTEVLLAADAILSHWPPFSHDGDFGGPPAFVQLDDQRAVSLADAFQAFVRAIDAWREQGALPESVALKPLRGPVDFPAFELRAEQTLDHQKRLQGYEPRRIPREAMPAPKLVASQGLPACGDFHVWIQTHTKADADDLIAAVKRVAEAMTDHVPGVIMVNLLCHTRKGEPDAKHEIAVNPAEFLYALAQEYRALAARGKPNDVVLVSKKVTPEQVCKLLLPSGGHRFEGFIHRGYLSSDELDAAWTRMRRE